MPITGAVTVVSRTVTGSSRLSSSSTGSVAQPSVSCTGVSINSSSVIGSGGASVGFGVLVPLDTLFPSDSLFPLDFWFGSTTVLSGSIVGAIDAV